MIDEQQIRKTGPPAHIVDIPVEFYDNFRDDPITAWQSYGSIPQESEFPYFENRQAVHAMVDKSRPNPMNSRHEFIPSFRCEDDYYRFMHVDLGWTHDACGVSMCYVSDWRRVRVRKEDEIGEYYFVTEFRPEFTFDFLCVLRPDGNEIIFEDVRRIIYEVNNRGFPLLLITFDRFQSVDTMQILRRGSEDGPGFICANLSLDKTTTYPIINTEKVNNFEKMSVGTGKYANLAVWSHGKVAVNAGRVHLPFYEPQTDTSTLALNGEYKDIDDFGHRLEETDYITLVEKEALGATFDQKALRVKESPKGSIDLLESVMGSMFNASNNVTVQDIEETPHERRMRLARKANQARTVFDKQDVQAEIEAEDEENVEGSDNEDRSIFDEGDNFDETKLY